MTAMRLCLLNRNLNVKISILEKVVLLRLQRMLPLLKKLLKIYFLINFIRMELSMRLFEKGKISNTFCMLKSKKNTRLALQKLLK